MSIGAGIAIAGIWIAAAMISTSKHITGSGMLVTLVAATIATGMVVLR